MNGIEGLREFKTLYDAERSARKNSTGGGRAETAAAALSLA